ncbi:hypothetical protein [Methylomonas sp. YC3]
MADYSDNLLEINRKFSSEHWLDFEVLSLEEGQLKIVGSTDLCYYHLIEIDFLGLRYFQGPMSWGSNPSGGDIISCAEDSVSKHIVDKYAVESPSISIQFNTDAGFQVIVVSADISVNYDTVYYYDRECLGLNERIDPRFLRSPLRQD